MTAPLSLKLKKNQNLPPSLKKKNISPQEDSVSFDTDNDLDREIERNQAQFLSRMIERVGGIPGDIYSILPEYIKKFNPLNVIHEKLPTSQKLQEISEKATLGYTSPKTSFEKKTGEFVGDIASFSVGAPHKTIIGNLSRMVGIPLAGQLAKEGIQHLGGKNKAQEYGKLGTMLLLDLWGLRKGIAGGGAKKFGETSLKEAEASIPKGARADVRVFDKQLNRLEKNLKSGITGPHTSEAIRVIDEIKGHITDGTIEAAKFPLMRKDINKLIENMKGFSIGGPSKAIRRASVDNINKVKQSLIQAGNRWGRGQSPEFFKKWREGNEALAVYHRSNDLSRFITKNAKIKNPVLKIMFGIHGYQHPAQYVGLKALGKGAEVATRFPAAMIYRVMKSKVLSKLYANVMKEAIKGNSVSVANSIDKMEKEMGKRGIE